MTETLKGKIRAEAEATFRDYQSMMSEAAKLELGML